ncbi:Top3 protein [Candida orthopsilosis Co 90-125]|uniref:DNA topoisomerase n=1 Tax=Candida orthopsilosis (strain 90-125) TaxID=1136231 RepID=H8X2J6_CANO9|nr:Top3 protein [Candida orthopsilosis Co 90-125]CCG25543.1 Top3 protein [Candida orthopsilosis Co 90-125]
MKILCVAEKPSIAKEVANILGGGRVSVRNSKNKYIKNYDFKFAFPDRGLCDVTMTSVVGHITNLDFPPQYQWGKCAAERLFTAEIITKITKQDVFDNIAIEARNSDKLMIWTDCDREGEFIGKEIFDAAKKGNSRISLSDVWRSKFSHLERNHILRAAKSPIELDMKAASAVSCRMELDFRVGTSFTRLLTDNLKSKNIIDKKDIASYGTCQFPTLGFVVDRYKRVKSFKPEPFWYIEPMLRKESKRTTFNWVKGHIFDRLYVLLMYERCLKHEQGEITKLETKPTSNYRPLPLTTVELQKDCAKYFKMSAKATLEAAEKLYNRGFISYPRTETDKYPPTMDFKGIFEKQKQDSRWGSYSGGLLSNGHEQPRNGSHDDHAHPAIHPVNYVSIDSLGSANEKKVYEYVVRRFLACCSKDAKGMLTSATLKWGDEFFTASGLMVTERNYLDIFTYKKWESSKSLPSFHEGEKVKISSGLMKEGKTSPPQLMTEPELIALMDANGIGTDATIAEHIDKILSRKYVTKVKRGKVEYIEPSPLGIGLIEGFDKMEFNGISLSKPFLRKALENSLQDICNGTKTKPEVVEEMKRIYHDAYGICSQKVLLLTNECRTIIQSNTR